MSVKDCSRLGKYDENKSRPRPLLVQLHRANDASQILAKRSSLASSAVQIFPDLSPAERKTRSLLLAERRTLIASNIDRKSVKICGNYLYVNNLLHASVNNGVLQKHPTLGDVSPKLQNLADQVPIVNQVSNPSDSPTQSVNHQ